MLPPNPSPRERVREGERDIPRSTKETTTQVIEHKYLTWLVSGFSGAQEWETVFGRT